MKLCFLFLSSLLMFVSVRAGHLALRRKEVHCLSGPVLIVSSWRYGWALPNLPRL